MSNPESSDEFEPGEVTAWLQRAAAGDEEAREHAYVIVRDELRRIAARNMSSADGLSLEATMIVNDAFLKLLDQTAISWESRGHFFAYACHVVRHLLIDHARARLRLRRNPGTKPRSLELAEDVIASVPPPSSKIQRDEELLHLDQALERLENDHPELAEVVKLHYFGGWSFEQIGRQIIDRHPGTVRRQWGKARTLLHLYLSETTDSEGD